MTNADQGVPSGAPPPRAADQACHIATLTVGFLESMTYLGRCARFNGEGRTATFRVRVHSLGQIGMDAVLWCYDKRQVGTGLFEVQIPETTPDGLAV